MKRPRFIEEQITGILKEQEAGAKTADACRKHVQLQPPGPSPTQRRRALFQSYQADARPCHTVCRRADNDLAALMRHDAGRVCQDPVAYQTPGCRDRSWHSKPNARNLGKDRPTIRVQRRVRSENAQGIIGDPGVCAPRRVSTRGGPSSRGLGLYIFSFSGFGGHICPPPCRQTPLSNRHELSTIDVQHGASDEARLWRGQEGNG